MTENKDLYIFIDESGNFDFSPTGTKQFVLTAITTTQPLGKNKRLRQIRYKLLSSGHDQESFHATEDRQFVRDQVFAILKNDLNFTIDSVIAQKNKTNPSLYKKEKYKDSNNQLIYEKTENEFYRLNCRVLLQYIFKRYEKTEYENIIVVLSSIFTKNKRQLILKFLKPYLKQHTSKRYYIYFHQAEADINSQIADYCCWAIYVKHERDELRPYKEIKNKIESEFRIFKSGKKIYY